MPTYVYRCSACQHELEAFQFLSEAPLRACPACAALTLEKQVTAAAGVVMAEASGPCGPGQACPITGCGAPAGGCGMGMCGMN